MRARLRRHPATPPEVSTPDNPTYRDMAPAIESADVYSISGEAGGCVPVFTRSGNVTRVAWQSVCKSNPHALPQPKNARKPQWPRALTKEQQEKEGSSTAAQAEARDNAFDVAKRC
jgi:hypothetical protein